MDDDVMGTERPARSLVADSLQTALLKAGLHGVGLMASILLTRSLGPAGRGSYVLPVVAAGLMVTLCKLGVEQANVFLVGTKGVAWVRVAGQNGLIGLGVGLVGALLLPGVGVAIPTLIPDTPTSWLVLAAGTIPLSLHTQFSAGLLTLRGEVTWQFKAGLLAGLAHVAVLGCLYLADAFTIPAVLLANTLSVAIAWLVTVWPLYRLRLPWWSWDATLLRETLRQALPLHLAMIVYALHFRVDMFMVKGLAGAAALGNYSLAVALAETMLFGAEALAVALLPRQVVGDLAGAAVLALRAARASAILSAGLALAWVLGGGFLIPWVFGTEFRPAYAPLVALAPGIVLLSMERMCGGPILRTGQSSRIAATYAAALCLNVTLNFLLIPHWGILGAAWASSVSYGVEALLILTWTARLAGVRCWEGIRPAWADVAALASAAGAARTVFRFGRTTDRECR